MLAVAGLPLIIREGRIVLRYGRSNSKLLALGRSGIPLPHLVAIVGLLIANTYRDALTAQDASGAEKTATAEEIADLENKVAAVYYRAARRDRARLTASRVACPAAEPVSSFRRMG